MTDPAAINEDVLAKRKGLDRFYAEVERVLVGQRPLVDRMLVGLLTGGHLLLEGVPGLAKTLAVRTVARTLHLSFSRIQFTPDLLPADVHRHADLQSRAAANFRSKKARSSPT